MRPLLLLALLLLPTMAFGEEIKVGVLLPLSGPHDDLGAAALDGIKWGLAEDAPFVIEVFDTEGDPDKAAALVDELSTDPSILAILGPIGAKESLAAAKRAQEHGLPMVSLSSSPEVNLVGSQIFRARVPAEAQSKALAKLALLSLGLTRAAIFYPDSDYGVAAAEAFASAFMDAGGALASYESYPKDESKPREEAELLTGKRKRILKTGSLPALKTKKRAKAALDFDVLFIPDHAQGVVRSLSFLQVAGLPLGNLGDVQLLGTSAWSKGDLSSADGLATGALLTQVYDPYISEAAELAAYAFEDTFGRTPTDFEAQIFDGVLLVKQALLRCRESQERGCAKQGLSSASVEGLNGTLHFGKEGGISRDLLVYSVDALGSLHPTF